MGELRSVGQLFRLSSEQAEAESRVPSGMSVECAKSCILTVLQGSPNILALVNLLNLPAWLTQSPRGNEICEEA